MKTAFKVILYLLFWIITTYAFSLFWSLEAEEITIDIEGEELVERSYNLKLQYFIIIGSIFRIIFFYGLLHWGLPMWKQKQTGRYFFLTLIMLIVFISIENAFAIFYYGKVVVSMLLPIQLIIYFFYALVALIILLYTIWAWKESINLEYKEKLAQVELAALKSQFDPHFIFNTLNNLLYIAESEGNEKIAEAIDKTGSLLRAVIYDFQGKITLEKELELIEKYVHLIQLKYDSSEPIHINISYALTDKEKLLKIAPLVLLPWIENACKHGVLPETYCIIHAEFKVKKDHELVCCFKNTIHEHKTNPIHAHGIGMKNIQNRLDILYPDHVLEILHEDDMYIVNLILTLDD